MRPTTKSAMPGVAGNSPVHKVQSRNTAPFQVEPIMNIEKVTESSREFVIALNIVVKRRKFKPDECVEMASLALTDFLTERLGELGAAEKLRSAADALQQRFFAATSGRD